MKKRIVVLSLLVGALSMGGFALLSSPGFASDAAVSGAPMPGPMGPRAEMGHGRRFALMASLLGLSAEQQTKIKAVWVGHRKQVLPLIKELRTNERQLRSLAATTPFDEGAVHALELKQAELRTRLLADRVETRKQVDAILTPSQQQMAKTLRELMREGRGGHFRRMDFGPKRGGPQG